MVMFDRPERRLLSPDDERRVVAAIRAAERRTSGEIRVHVQGRCKGDPLAAAATIFERLGMTHTAARNGVLVFLAVDDRRFAIVGDKGIHEKVGAAFWDALRDALADRLRAGRAADGLIETVEAIGAELSRSFPRAGDDRNELADRVSYGGPL
ncbi:MAG TPA: TPM domain-containing protein [Candidatus Polarisedimenticolaceae bacterium]